MQFRDLNRQYLFLKDEMDMALVGSAASGTYIGGAPVSELEKLLADYVGVKHCITCANGTDALTIALKVFGAGAGDAVFVPDFTFFSTAETVAAEGACPIFVDVDPSTFNISVEDLEHKIELVKADGTLRPLAVIPVDLFGQPADFISLHKLADKYDLLLIEDGAQGFGGLIDGKKACSFGDIATTSFFPSKPLGCYGDGGAIFTDNDDWAYLASSLKIHGKGTSKYDNVRLGMNSRLDTIQAAVLKVKLKAFCNGELDAVNRVAKLYTELLEGVVVVPVIKEHYYSSWAQYTVKLSSREERDALQAHLKSKDIPSMVYYPTAMHAQTAFRDVRSFGPCNNADLLCNTVLSLPMHPYMHDDEVEIVCNEIKTFLKY